MSISTEGRGGRWVKVFVVGRRLRHSAGIETQYVIEDITNRQVFINGDGFDAFSLESCEAVAIARCSV